MCRYFDNLAYILQMLIMMVMTKRSAFLQTTFHARGIRVEMEELARVTIHLILVIVIL